MRTAGLLSLQLPKSRWLRVSVIAGGVSLVCFILIYTIDLEGMGGGSSDGMSLDTLIMVSGAAVISLLVSITSLIGFVLTLIVTLRKERREKDISKLNLEKTRLEIENLKRQLDDQDNKVNPEPELEGKDADS